MAVNGLRLTELLTLMLEELVPRKLDMAAVETERTELIVGRFSEEENFWVGDRIELDRNGAEEDEAPDEEDEPVAETIDKGGDRPVEKLELEATEIDGDVAATEGLRKPEDDDRIKALL